MIRKYIILFVIGLYVFGCAGSKSYVQFEILEPAIIPYPKHISKVAFLNQAPLTGFIRNENNSAEPIEKSYLHIVDTIVINGIERGFLEGKNSEESSMLEEVVFLESRRTEVLEKSEEISADIKKAIFEKYNPDALIVLDYYNLSLKKSNPYYSYSQLGAVVEYQFIMEINWKVYLENLPTAIDAYLQIDTLYFANQLGKSTKTYYSATRALRTGSEAFGYDYGLRHIPHWNYTERILFRGGDKSLKLAATETDSGNWEGAVAIWNEYINYEEKIIAAKANHNLAVFYEFEDDLIKAGNYASKAEALWKNDIIKSYRKELDFRILDKEELIKQLN